MALPTLDGTGTLMSDVRRGRTGSDKKWAGGTLRFTSRKRTAAGAWEDDTSIVVSVVGFEQAAEELARYSKGDVIAVVGRIKSLGLWQPKTGSPRPELSMFLDHVTDPPARTRDQAPSHAEAGRPA